MYKQRDWKNAAITNPGIILLAVVLGFARPPAFAAASRATPGILKLQSLAGDWEGKDERGRSVKTSFKLIAGETAVLETLAMPGMEEMVTIYSQDGDGIALLHYCPTNNQPRMRAVPPPGEVKELVFEFEGAGNLASPDEGHEHKLVMQFQDKDHITERWTWRSNGKDTEMVYRFARKDGNAK
ncbi:MAG TPA: hypothetical protein VKV95_21155 [Terriglobia bacterium]|nr:hypothetical protein [Terriglobia bacterium]